MLASSSVSLLSKSVSSSEESVGRRSMQERYPTSTRLSMASCAWIQIGVFLGSGIYLIKVNANVQTSVFLAPQYDCVTL